MKACLDLDLVPDLNETDAEILKVLKGMSDSDFTGLRIGQLSEEVGKAKSHVSERVTFLEKHDLVVREVPEGSSGNAPRVRLKDPDRFEC